jgi:hypothetical protein
MTLRNAFSAILFSLTIPHAALAFEAPPTAKAEAVLGAEATGLNYRVDPAAPHEQGQPVLATTGELTPLAKEEISRLGWTVQFIH